MATIGSLVLQIEAQSASLHRDLARTERAMAQTSRQVAQQNRAMQTAFAATTRAVNVLRTAAVGLGLGVASIGFSSMVRGALSAGDALAKQSRQLGISIESLQAYQRGAQLAGVEHSQLATSLEQFNRRLGEAERGQGQLARTLEAANIPLRDQGGNLRSTSALLQDYADLIARTEGASAKAALAADAFGRSGGRMLEFLKDGSAGLREMETALEDSIHVTTEQAAAIERFNDRLTSASQTVETTWIVSLGNALIAGERWAAQFDDLSKRIRDFFGITDAMAAEWGKGWLPARRSCPTSTSC
jgi:hypothetical protein